MGRPQARGHDLRVPIADIAEVPSVVAEAPHLSGINAYLRGWGVDTYGVGQSEFIEVLNVGQVVECIVACWRLHKCLRQRVTWGRDTFGAQEEEALPILGYSIMARVENLPRECHRITRRLEFSGQFVEKLAVFADGESADVLKHEDGWFEFDD